MYSGDVIATNSHIKVKVITSRGSETFWAVPLPEPNTARIDNIPILAGEVCGFNDVVEYHPADGPVKSFKSLVHRVTVTGVLHCLSTRHHNVARFLERHGIGVEFVVPGHAAIAIPIAKGKEEVLKVLEDCPHVLNHNVATLTWDTPSV